MQNTIATLLSLVFLPTMAFADDRQQQEITTLIADHSHAERVFNLPLNDGKRLTVLFSTPTRPRGTIIMLPGGTGDIGLQQDGRIGQGDNFVVRTRDLWNKHGYAVLIPDTINHTNLRGRRSSSAYARLVEELAAFAHQPESGPVFLLGTS